MLKQGDATATAGGAQFPQNLAAPAASIGGNVLLFEKQSPSVSNAKYAQAEQTDSKRPNVREVLAAIAGYTVTGAVGQLGVDAVKKRTSMAESTTPSREEIDAKLDAANARAEARITEMSGNIDLKFAHLENKLDALIGASNELKAETKFSRWTIIGIVVAAMGVMFAAQANYISSFTAGIAAFQVKGDQSKADSVKEPPKEVVKK